MQNTAIKSAFQLPCPPSLRQYWPHSCLLSDKFAAATNASQWHASFGVLDGGGNWQRAQVSSHCVDSLTFSGRWEKVALAAAFVPLCNL
jgi:hypothetical protein